jgi:thioredoxin-dependent peroxiredoxin
MPDPADRQGDGHCRDPRQGDRHRGLLDERDRPGFGVVGEPAGICPLGQIIDGRRELVAGLVDLLPDGVRIPLSHSRPPCPRRTKTGLGLGWCLPTYPKSARTDPHVPVNRKGPSVTETARLAPGDKAPAFTLPDADGKKVSLADYMGRRVIVYFYPAASTPGCTKEACDFRDSLAELNGAGLDVVGISPDKPEKLAKFRDAEGLTFPLLSDPDRKVLTAWGAYGEKQMYGKTVTGVIRSTFVVDEKGKIVVAQYNVKATGHVAKLRRDLSV